MVTLTPSSRNASSSGGGRKSIITLASIGSLVYLILVFINSLSFTPVASSKNSNHPTAIGKSHSEYAAVSLAKTKVELLSFAVGKVFGNNTLGIGKSELCQGKMHTVPFLVLRVLVCIPLKSYLAHVKRLTQTGAVSHINVWAEIWPMITYNVEVRGCARVYSRS